LRLRANVTNTAVRRRGEVKTDVNAYKKGLKRCNGGIVFEEGNESGYDRDINH